jgi:hypothetical protein
MKAGVTRGERDVFLRKERENKDGVVKEGGRA